MSDTTLPVAQGDGGNMNIGMSDPNNMQAPNQSAGGKTKIKPSESSVDSRDQHINGDKVSLNGMAPSGENSSGIPAAQPIDPLTFGDPNDSALDFKDGMDPNSVDPSGPDIERHGF
jgi:hypothetical protein